MTIFRTLYILLILFSYYGQEIYTPSILHFSSSDEMLAIGSMLSGIFGMILVLTDVIQAYIPEGSISDFSSSDAMVLDIASHHSDTLQGSSVSDFTSHSDHHF